MRTLIICSFFCIEFGENRGSSELLFLHGQTQEVLNEEFAGAFLVFLLEKYNGSSEHVLCPVHHFTLKYHHNFLSAKTTVTL